MGFIRDAVHNHHMNDPVRGTALVADVNDWLLETRKPYTLRTTLVVQAEGVPKTTVEHSEIVNADTGTHLDRWPAQGDTIPVTIDRAPIRRGTRSAATVAQCSPVLDPAPLSGQGAQAPGGPKWRSRSLA